MAQTIVRISRCRTAILAGEKTTTTGLVADYEHENEPLPSPGLRQVVVDSAGRPVAVIETTTVRGGIVPGNRLPQPIQRMSKMRISSAASSTLNDSKP